MEKIIYKYQIRAIGVNDIQLPKGSKILTVMGQNDNVIMWVELNEGAEMEERSFVIRATGERFKKENDIYIGTASVMNGGLIWHVYELVSTNG